MQKQNHKIISLLAFFLILPNFARAEIGKTDTGIYLRPSSPPTFDVEHKAVDPTFGSTIFRVTGPVGSNAYNEGINTQNIAPVQHFTGPWNKDGNRFIVWYDRKAETAGAGNTRVRQYEFDPANFAITGYKDMKSYDGSAGGNLTPFINYNRYITYSHASPELVYGISGPNNDKIATYDFATEIGTILTQPDWLTIFKGAFLDAIMVSDDENIFGFSVYNVSAVGNESNAYVVWNRSTNAYSSIDMKPFKVSFTANSTTDLISYPYADHANDDAVVISTSTGTLPSPLVSDTTYYIRDLSVMGAASTFKLSETQGGAAIDLTTNGSGTNYVTTKTGSWIDTGSGPPKPSALFMSRDGRYVRTQGSQGVDVYSYVYLYPVSWDQTTVTIGSFNRYDPYTNLFAGKMSYYDHYVVNEDAQYSGSLGYQLWYRDFDDVTGTKQRIFATPAADRKFFCHPAISQGGGYVSCGLTSASMFYVNYGTAAWTLDSGGIYSKAVTGSPTQIDWFAYKGVAYTKVSSKSEITGAGMYWYDATNHIIYTWITGGGQPIDTSWPPSRAIGGVWPVFADELVLADTRNNIPNGGSPTYPHIRLMHMWNNFDAGDSDGGNSYDETPTGLSWDNKYALVYTRWNSSNRHDVFVVNTGIGSVADVIAPSVPTGLGVM